jgi:hypothetical protein
MDHRHKLKCKFLRLKISNTLREIITIIPIHNLVEYQNVGYVYSGTGTYRDGCGKFPASVKVLIKENDIMFQMISESGRLSFSHRLNTDEDKQALLESIHRINSRLLN